MPNSLASRWVIMPFDVDMINSPTSGDGRYLFSHFSNSFFLTGNLGFIAQQLFILPKSCTLILPHLPSSLYSQFPIYPCFNMTLRTFAMSFEAGIINASLLALISQFFIVVRALAKVSFITINYNPLHVLLKSKLRRYFSKASSAYHKAILTN